KRIVAYPSAAASRVTQIRVEAQVPANPADRVVHPAVFIRAEIEDIHCAAGPLQRQQNGVDAVLHIKVRLTLGAVAQHAELIGMRQELLVKVEDVSMRIALAQNRNETKDVASQAEALAIGGDQPFGGQLGGAVERR